MRVLFPEPFGPAKITSKGLFSATLVSLRVALNIFFATVRGKTKGRC